MDDAFDYDCHDSCIVWNRVTLYGVPSDLTDSQMEEIYQGSYQSAIKVGSIFGCLILCKQMVAMEQNPHMICDDVDSDLEYVISALGDHGEPLSSDLEQDIYYIHEFEMENEYNNVQLKTRILEELPGFIQMLFHVAPDIITYYPSPLEYIPDPESEKRYEALQNIAKQKLDNITSDYSLESANDKVLSFGEAYQFTEDELNLVMRRRNSESSNRAEFDFYENNGFEESGNSRLLFKMV